MFPMQNLLLSIERNRLQRRSKNNRLKKLHMRHRHVTRTGDVHGKANHPKGLDVHFICQASDAEFQIDEFG
jgi:hypothetical protein